jgi:hypothetical protein
VTWQHEQVAPESLPTAGWWQLDRIAELGPLLESIDQPSPIGA